MAEFLSIEVAGNTELREQIADALRRLERPRELMQVLGATLEENINRRFDQKRDPNGEAWKPLAASTRKTYDGEDTAVKGGKRAAAPSRRGTLLERTRQMRNSLAANAGDDYTEVGMTRLTDDGKWQIPLLHEFGTSRGMPRRGIFFADPEAGTLGAEDERDLEADIVGFLDDVFGV